MILRLLSTLPLMVLYSCSAPRLGTTLQQNAPEGGEMPKPVILTLVLKATWDTDSTVLFSIYNDIRNEGHLKQKTAFSPASGFLLYFTSAEGNKMDSTHINHPLQEYAEVRNEQGKSSLKLFTNEEAYTETKVNFLPGMKKVTLINLRSRHQQVIDIP